MPQPHLLPCSQPRTSLGEGVPSILSGQGGAVKEVMQIPGE